MDWSYYFKEMSKVYEKLDPSHQHSAFSKFEGQNSFIRDYGLEVVPLVRAATQEYEQMMGSGFTPYPELIEFIKNAQGYEMFVYSSNSRATVTKGLEELEIANYFKKIVSRDEATYIKPDPDGFKLIYSPAVSKNEYLMIGNSYADKKMAAAVGIDFYLVDFFRPIF